MKQSGEVWVQAMYQLKLEHEAEQKRLQRETANRVREKQYALEMKRIEREHGAI